MSRSDFLTGKKAMSGNKVSHSVRHTRRIWSLNLQNVKYEVSPGNYKTIKVSAKTLKTLKKKGLVVNPYTKKANNNTQTA
ncbi:MAG: 50S ribosomal protein L28 [Mycoplasmataceae bacterium]|jgi:large subunit ribosomal protein L28|nr:50S ribosomal protein L28 [Mycoplasmataceae bacterium]